MWSIFDARTIVTLLALLMAMCTGVVGLLLLSRRPTPAASEWGCSMLIFVVSSMFLLIRQPGFNWWPLNIGIALAVLTCMLALRGIQRWNGHPNPSWIPTITAPLLTLLFLNFARITDLPNSYQAAISPGFTGAILGYCVYEAWFKPGLKVATQVLLFLTLLQALRTVLYVAPIDPIYPVMSALVLSGAVTVAAIVFYRIVAQRTEALHERC